ncbi:hypothetical protein [Erythrobacter sp. R86502]|uniref:hypothetical protein n=1 Tax=Erythrobacter sp. R86502 TaxID=3093846 RepID=UPI0036D250E7
MKLPLFAMISCVASAVPAAALAQAECQPTFVDAAQTLVVRDIVVGRDDFAIEYFQVGIRNAGTNGACSATLRVARLSTSPTINPTPLKLQSRGQAVAILPSETAPGTPASNLRIAQVSAGPNGFALPFQLEIASGWGTKSGAQTEDLILLLVDNLGQIVDTLPFTIELNIPAAAEVRVVGATGTDRVAQIDLGELDPTATTLSEQFGIRVWSTSAYSVQFESENRGELVHSEQRGRIPYDLRMDSRSVSLVGGVAAQVPRGTDALGDFHPLRLQVPPFSARAGAYADRVRVTVTAS